MSSTLRIEAYFKDLPQGCCANKIYALVFRQNNQALKLSGPTYLFDTFTAAALDSFKIELSEHAQRSKYYYADLSAASVALIPDTAHDEPYWLEFWLKEGAGGRTLDTLYEVRPFWWQNHRLTWDQLSFSDKSNLDYFKAHVVVSFDSTLSKLRFVGWLEKNGRLVTAAETCSIKWLTRAGLTVADFTISSAMPGMPGVFQAEQVIIDIDPDEAMPIQISVLYAGENYISEAGVASWD